MGKAKGVSKRRRKAQKPKFPHKSKLNKQKKKNLKKVSIKFKPIKDEWNSKISMNANIKKLGLSSDPNKTIPISKHIELNQNMDIDIDINEKNDKPLTKVVTDMTQIANKPVSKNFQLSLNTIKFCAYMIEKYGEDYAAMSRDSMNYYQESKGQIKRKIKKFKSFPSYLEAYEKAKQIVEEN